MRDISSESEYKRWLEEAIGEFETARWDLAGDKYSAVCFWSQQIAEKALMAFLYHNRREEYIFERSVVKLIEYCTELEEKFGGLKDAAITLDRYYVPTRYPYGLPYPAVPSKSYTRKDAEESLMLCETIMELVKEELDWEEDEKNKEK